MNTRLLESIAAAATEKTILAADESTRSIQKRLDTIGLASNPENNRHYRNMLFTTPDIEKFISGVIMYDETVRQNTDDGTPFPVYLGHKNILPGIKVDTGTESFEHEPDTITNGLDGLPDRLKEYRSLGARFAKWRALFTISLPDHPSDAATERNAHDLAEYARHCQEFEIVPIVEPEVLMAGSHSIAECAEVTMNVLTSVFAALKKNNVHLPGIILKPNMITAGSDHAEQASVHDVAQKTLDVLKKTTPQEVPAITFLSGGQSPDLATDHLREINTIKNSNESEYPWRITASYGRALQSEALETWQGKEEYVEKAQEIFLKRAEKVWRASNGL